MAIKTSVFGGWTLSGEDAEAFSRQSAKPAKNKLAKAAYNRGKKLLQEFEEKGYATITCKKSKDKK